MDTRLKAQMLKAIVKRYISSLDDSKWGFGRVTAKQVLAYLIKEYGQIEERELEANCEALNAPWNSKEPIRGLWDCIKECQQIGKTGGSPISYVNQWLLLSSY